MQIMSLDSALKVAQLLFSLITPLDSVCRSALPLLISMASITSAIQPVPIKLQLFTLKIALDYVCLPALTIHSLILLRGAVLLCVLNFNSVILLRLLSVSIFVLRLFMVTILPRLVFPCVPTVHMDKIQQDFV
jgi:hypothetical protein